ncbi:MAG TPA: hypothetical protein VGJ60_10440 [Chloroflexota bacterium]|jgi:uncharacterized membrane protein
MSDSGTEQAVIASFDSQAQAEQAAKDLMGWDKANDDVKLGAIGVLTKDDKGEIKTRNYSQRKTGKGAKVGMGLGVIAAVFSGGLTLIPSAIGGAVAGGAAGALFRKGLGMSDEDLQKLSADLDGGRAALLVMCDANEVQATSEYLTAAGGKTQSHAVNAAELETAAKAAEEAPQ